MKSVLFVDDEPNVLSGLKRMLRPRRAEWSLHFASSGREALELLQTLHCDVLVTDMRMPDIDGAELLRRTQASHPGVVRIVLSGHAELETALRAVPLAHQFMTKPTEPERLCRTIERACSIQDMLSNPSLRKAVSGIRSLPVLPVIYHELTEKLADENVDLVEAARIVEKDPGLSAKLLKVVNSAFFGVPRRVSGIQDAALMLGSNMLKNLVLGASLFSPDEHALGLDLAQEQQRGMLVGRLAMQMLERRQHKEDAFAAGVLLTLGRYLVAIQAREALESILAAVAGGMPRVEAELQVLGASAAQMGAYLLGLWGLPYSIVEAVAYHERPSQVEARDFDPLGAVHVANALISPGADLDELYVDQSGIRGSLPEWRKAAERIEGAS